MTAQVDPSPTHAQAGNGGVKEESPPQKRTPSKPFSKWVRLILLTLCGLWLLFLGHRLYRLGTSAWSFYQQVEGLQAEIAGAESLAALASLEPDLMRIAAQFNVVERESDLFVPLLEQLAWVPKYGPSIAALPELLLAAGEGIHMATEALPLVKPVLLREFESGGGLLRLLSATLAEQPAVVDSLAERSQRMADALGALPVAELHPKIGEPLNLIQPYLRLIPAALRVVPSAPGLLGMDRPHHYLILVQNNHELRATGGFLTAVGEVVVHEGEMSDLRFLDSYRIKQNTVDLPAAPRPIARYMGIHSLTFRDANWSPDLPVTARTIQAIYAQTSGVQIDGVVTVDLRAAELLVDALGPLQIEGAEEPLTGNTLLEQILAFWSTPLDTGDTLAEAGLGRWWRQRKDFMPKLVDAALRKMKSGVDYGALTAAGIRALDERSIQIWLDDPFLAEQLALLGWDGALRPLPEADFVAPVDSNLGYNKVDLVLEREIAYSVSWVEGESGGSSAVATAVLHYSHPLDVAEHQCRLTPRYGESYTDMAARCYFNFVRLYVPGGSEMIRTAGLEKETLEVSRGENGTQVFGGYFVLKPGEEKNVSFTYRLPAKIRAEDYQLLIRRQSGTQPLPFTISIAGRETSGVIDRGEWLWTSDPPGERRSYW